MVHKAILWQNKLKHTYQLVLSTYLVTPNRNNNKSQLPTAKIPDVRYHLGTPNTYSTVITLQADCKANNLCSTSHYSSGRKKLLLYESCYWFRITHLAGRNFCSTSHYSSSRKKLLLYESLLLRAEQLNIRFLFYESRAAEAHCTSFYFSSCSW